MKRKMRIHDFKDGIRVEQRKIGKEQLKGTMRGMEWKEGNLSRVDWGGRPSRSRG